MKGFKTCKSKERLTRNNKAKITHSSYISLELITTHLNHVP